MRKFFCAEDGTEFDTEEECLLYEETGLTKEDLELESTWKEHGIVALNKRNKKFTIDMGEIDYLFVPDEKALKIVMSRAVEEGYEMDYGLIESDKEYYFDTQREEFIDIRERLEEMDEMIKFAKTHSLK